MDVGFQTNIIAASLKTMRANLNFEFKEINRGRFKKKKKKKKNVTDDPVYC